MFSSKTMKTLFLSSLMLIPTFNHADDEKTTKNQFRNIAFPIGATYLAFGLGYYLGDKFGPSSLTIKDGLRIETTNKSDAYRILEVLKSGYSKISIYDGLRIIASNSKAATAA